MPRVAKRKLAETAVQLPAERIQARRFGKTRSAQSQALREDYVELIADLLSASGEARPTDVARRLGVSPCNGHQGDLTVETGWAGDGPPLSWDFSDGGGAKAGGARQGASQARGGCAACNRRPSRSRGGRRGGHRAPRLRDYAEGIRRLLAITCLNLFRPAISDAPRGGFSVMLHAFNHGTAFHQVRRASKQWAQAPRLSGTRQWRHAGIGR